MHPLRLSPQIRSPMLLSPSFRTDQFGFFRSAPATLPFLNHIPKAFKSIKWKSLGTLQPPHPETKILRYGGRPFEAVVIRAKMPKTVMVQADRWVRHPTFKVLFKKRIRVMTHDENNICHVGDKVLVVPSRPHSRHKAHEICKILVKEPGILYLTQHPEKYTDFEELLRIQKQEEEARKIVILKPEDKIKQRQGTAEQPAVPAPPVVSPEKIEKKAKTKNKKKKKIPKVSNKMNRRQNVRKKVDRYFLKKKRKSLSVTPSLTDAISAAEALSSTSEAVSSTEAVAM